MTKELEDYRFRWPHGRLEPEVAEKYDEATKAVNEALLETIFDVAKSLGMRPKNVDMGDSYFIFSGAPASRCSFELTGLLPGWLFGVWLEGQLLADERVTEMDDVEDDTPVVQLFCQHKSVIDKFKPSRSPVLVKVTLRDLRLMLDGRLERKFVFDIPVKRMLLAIRRHPALVYTDNVDPEYPPTMRIVPTSLRWLGSWAWERTHDDVMLRVAIAWARRKKRLAEQLPCVTKCTLQHETPGEQIHSWPPVELIVNVDEDTDIDDAADQVLSVFDSDSFGRMCHWGEACHVDFLCGKGEMRGWYGLV